MRSIICVALLISSVLIAGCKTKKTIQLNSQESKIVFGYGGGFAGLETIYSLRQDGSIATKNDLDDIWVVHHRIEKNQAAQILSQISDLGLGNYHFSEPGNTYKFLEISLPEKENRIVWGIPDHTPKKEVIILYELLINFIKECNMKNL